MKALVSLVAAVSLQVSGVPAVGSAPWTSAEADWMVQLQLPQGAIADVGGTKVVPYWSNFAAMGLARAFEVTRNTTYSAAAWRYLSWYQSQMNASGFVTDYTVSGRYLTSTGDMDSTDSYAGTFLLAAWRLWKADPDRAKLVALSPAIAKAVAAIEATQDTDGLTWAKPTWHYKYLMDQSEVYAGLRGAAQLAQALNNGALSQRATADAAKVAAGVATLWNPALGSYDWVVYPNTWRLTTNWKSLYPDALEQLWPVAFGLVTGARATTLVNTFNAAHPKWDVVGAMDVYGTTPGKVLYNPVAGWAFAKVGQTARATLAAQNLGAAAQAGGRGWPYTIGNAGQLLQLATSDPNRVP